MENLFMKIDFLLAQTGGRKESSYYFF